MRPTLKQALRFLPILALLIVWACSLNDSVEDQYLTWHLSEGLKDYKRVEINLVDVADPTLVYEHVWNDTLPDPVHFKKYRLGAAKDKNFTIQIRCYGADGGLLLSKDVKVEGKTQKSTQSVLTDPRLHALSLSTGTLVPPFRPDITEYTAQVDSALASLTLTATPLDPVNTLVIDQKSALWNSPYNEVLKRGANVFEVEVLGPDGKLAKSYQVTVTRGTPIADADVKSVSLAVKDTLLYAGDPSIALAAVTDPVGAPLAWASRHPETARVDGNGNVTPVEAGETYVVVKAGAHVDSTRVRVVRDVPQVTVGPNLAVIVGTEVTFPISIRNDHGAIVCFKYDLDGDGTWDNADTVTVPEFLKFTYMDTKTYTARFYVRDSEGNKAEPTRLINVRALGSLRIAITYPGHDTTVTKTPITVSYTVNDIPLTRKVDLKEGVATKVVVDTTVDSKRDSAFILITLDTTPPAMPTVSSTTFASPFRPIWTRSGATTGGSGTFRFRLDNPALDSASPVTVKTFTPSADLAAGDHYLYVQERDSVGNWSQSGKALVTLVAPDNTPPNAPKLSGQSPTNVAPKWNWVTGEGGGSGDFKIKLEDSSLAGAAETRELSYTYAGTLESGKTYTLWVKERDAAGNWSKPASYGIVYDVTKPIVEIIVPQAPGTNYITKSATIAMSGKAGASGTNTIVKVTYSVNGGTASDASYANGAWSIASVNLPDNAVTPVTISAIDNLGNHSESILQVQRDNAAPTAPAIAGAPPTPSNAAKGTWTWTPGNDGTGSGLNGKYQYSLDGGATWTATSLTQAKDVALPEGTVSFGVQEQDVAGNWSPSAPSVIVVDRTAPKATVTNPVSGGNTNGIHVTLTGSITDVGGVGVGAGALIITGQKTGAAAAVVTGNTWSSADLTLNLGSDTLTLTATDLVGNVIATTWKTTVTAAKPVVAITYPARGFATNLDTVTMKYKVDNGAEQSQLITFSAGDGFKVLTATSAPNEAGLTGTDTLSVMKDKTGPNAPTVTPSNRSFTKVDPTWNFTTGNDIAGGSGAAATWYYKITSKSNPTVVLAAATITSATAASGSFTWTGAAEGDYYFLVQQQDKAGNWGPYSAISNVVVDKKAPVVSVVSPADGLVTSWPGVNLTCKIDGVDQPATLVDLTGAGGVNTLTCSKTDSAGNTGSKSITVYSAPKAIFVNDLPGGTEDGTTWGTAYHTIQGAMAAWSTGKEIWVAAGLYTAPATLDGFLPTTGMVFYGGFPDNGSAYAASMRTFAAADTSLILAAGSGANLFSISGNTSTSNPVMNVTIDGFKLFYSQSANSGSAVTMNYAGGITVSNCLFAHNQGSGSALYTTAASFVIDKCKFRGKDSEVGSVIASGGVATFSNTEFSGNVLEQNYTKELDLNFTTANITGCKFLDILPDGTFTSSNAYIYFSSTSGTLNVSGSTFKATQPPAIKMEPGSTLNLLSGNSFSP